MALNILVVDDSSVMRSMIIKTLKLSGLNVGDIHQASNGAEGLKILEGSWIDLALVDINMPVMNGEEMIARVRENPDTRDLSILVVSTESSEKRIENLLKMNAKVLHKPFTPEQLREKIVETLGDYNE